MLFDILSKSRLGYIIAFLLLHLSGLLVINLAMARTSQIEKNRRPTELDSEAQKEIVEWITGHASLPKNREITDWVKWRFEIDISGTEIYGSLVERAMQVFASKRLKVGSILYINCSEYWLT